MIIFFLGKFTSTVRLSWKLWLVSLAIAFIRFANVLMHSDTGTYVAYLHDMYLIIVYPFWLTSWPLAMVGKLIPVPERNFSDYFMGKSQRKKDLSGKYALFNRM